MSTHRCPPYKDTGLVWVGYVPSDWDVRRLGFYFSERRQKVSDTEFQPLSVTKLGIVPRLETAAKSDDGDNRKLVRQGDFVINGRSDRKGSSGLSTLEGSVSLINIVLRQISPANMGFMHYLLKSIPFQEEFYRFGRGIVDDLWSTPFSEMRNIKLAIPPIPEQHAIAAFLDRETAKIDALVAEQERLLALLVEKRKAVVSRAVTQGLDLSVPMKNTGVEWIGEVPAHWNIKRLNATRAPGSTITYGIVQAGPNVEGGIPYIRTSDMSGSELTSEGCLRTTPEIAAAYDRSKVEEGDLVVAIRATVGKSLIVPSELIGANLTQGTAKVSPGKSIASEFLYHVLNSSLAQQQFSVISKGVTFREITLDALRKFKIPLPSVVEQSQIIAHLKSSLSKIDELVGGARQASNLLRERRTALISAAVTGKIDVRSLAPVVEPAREAA